MTKFSLIAIAALFATSVAHAADPVAAPAKPAATVPVVQSVAVPAKVVTPAPNPPATAQKTSGHSQQDKMRECNKQATGKKGAERKAFMKTCLSKKA